MAVANLSRPALEAADRTHMIAALATFSRKQPEDWLGPSHPAGNGQLLMRWTDVEKTPLPRLIEAVAASAPNHCIDGWSYLSRAVSALVSGDIHACRHMAYYAQLRAGLSILANLGIGIFNGNNFAILASGKIKKLEIELGESSNLGTHQVVWEALHVWSQTPLAGRTFLELVKFRGSTLLECLEAVWPGAAPNVGASIIEAWGLDLKRGLKDRDDRNISSYAPQSLNKIEALPSDSLSFVARAWRLLEPSSESSFDNLDRFLLRSVLQKQHRILYKDKKYGSHSINSRYAELPPSIQSIVSRNFLIGREEKSDPDLLVRASDSADPSGPTQMLARALLLLRAATAFTHSSFVEANVQGKLRPWIDQWAVARGFWPPASPMDYPGDLWADVELALIELDESMTPPPQCLNDWLQKTTKGLPTICEIERAGVWSLAL